MDSLFEIKKSESDLLEYIQIGFDEKTAEEVWRRLQNR